MYYKVCYSKKFLKDFEAIKKEEPKRIKQISEIIKTIKENPFSNRLEFKKLKGVNDIFSYLVGKKYRLTAQINIVDKHIKVLRIRRRENFYSK